MSNRPDGLKTKIFLDSGNPEDTKKALDMLGFLDGQTTNPSLVAKHPEVQKCLVKDGKCTKEQVHGFYKEIIHEIAELLPDGDISVEVYANTSTTTEEMLSEGRELFSWAPQARVKFPTNSAGLEAASQAVDEGVRVNMTLVFSQKQAAAVYAATVDDESSFEKVPVYLSPFIGRLDDRGDNGMDLIRNTVKLYAEGDGHVEILTASVRNLDHFMAAVQEGTDIITVPMDILDEWAEKGMPIPDGSFTYERPELNEIQYSDEQLDMDWHSATFDDPLINKGITKFAQDWDALIGG